MGVKSKDHIIPGGGLRGDFGRDRGVQQLGAGEAQGAVYKILLIVHNNEQLFHGDKPPE